MRALVSFTLLAMLLFFPLRCSQQKERPQINPSLVEHPVWAMNKTIYEANIRQYTPEGTFKAFKQHLAAIKQLGAGIIWLMPVNPIGKKKRKGTLGSYYSVKDYRAINPEFGTLDDFRELVKTIHNMGMYVIMDWVANHCAWDNALLTEHPDWFTKDKKGAFVSPRPDWQDVVDFDYSKSGLRRYMIDAMKHWVRDFDVDGFRCGEVEMVPIEFWDQARRELQAVKPVLMLADGEAAYVHSKAFDISSSWKIYHALSSIAKEQALPEKIDSLLTQEKRQFPANAWRMRFITNHNENSWNGTAIGRLGDAIRPSAVLICTLPGKPMIYGGQEAGLNKSLRFFDKDLIPLVESPYRDFFSRLLNLYQSNPALYMGNFIRLGENSNKSVYAFMRCKEQYKILVLLNFSAENQDITLESSLMAGNYTELFSHVTIDKKDKENFTLEPWGYRVYVGNTINNN